MRLVINGCYKTLERYRMKIRLITAMIALVGLFSSPVSIVPQTQGITSSNVPTAANPMTIDFDRLSNLTSITNQYSDVGVSFTGATILGQGGSLNYLQFPPRSGLN